MNIRGDHIEPHAVIFDLGGVVLDSPLHFFADFERRSGLPAGFIIGIIGGYSTRTDGIWQKLETGHVTITEFCAAFDREVAALGATFSTAQMMAELADAIRIRPEMREAVRRVRATGRKVAALTNIWESDDALYRRIIRLRAEFDVFVESCVVGMRKPDPQIYEHTLRALGVTGSDAVFLDDIGHNLKPARALGMITIKVGEPLEALRELEQLLGIALL
jgi:epoxide hydrolase-like predicted phosphatase